MRYDREIAGFPPGHLDDGHARALGTQYLVPHAELRLPNAHRGRDRFPVRERRKSGAPPNDDGLDIIQPFIASK